MDALVPLSAGGQASERSVSKGTAGRSYQQRFQASTHLDQEDKYGRSFHDAGKLYMEGAATSFQAARDVDFLEKELDAWYQAEIHSYDTVTDDFQPHELDATHHHPISGSNFLWDNQELQKRGESSAGKDASTSHAMSLAMKVLKEENQWAGRRNFLDGVKWTGKLKNQNMDGEEQEAKTGTVNTSEQDAVSTHLESHQVETSSSCIATGTSRLDHVITTLTSKPVSVSSGGTDRVSGDGQTKHAVHNLEQRSQQKNENESDSESDSGSECSSNDTDSSDAEDEANPFSTKRSEEQSRKSSRTTTCTTQTEKLKKNSSGASHGETYMINILKAADKLAKCRRKFDKLVEESGATSIKLQKLYRRSDGSRATNQRDSYNLGNSQRDNRRIGAQLTAADLLNLHEVVEQDNPFDTEDWQLPSYGDRVGSYVEQLRKIECSLPQQPSGSSFNARYSKSPHTAVSSSQLSEVENILENSIRDLQSCEVDMQSLTEMEKEAKKQVESTEQWLIKEINGFRREFLKKFAMLGEVLRQFKYEFLENDHRVRKLSISGPTHNESYQTLKPEDENEEKAYEDFTALSPKGAKEISHDQGNPMNRYIGEAWYISPQLNCQFGHILSLARNDTTAKELIQQEQSIQTSVFGSHPLEDYVDWLKLQNEYMATRLAASEHQVAAYQSENEDLKRSYKSLLQQLEYKLKLTRDDLQSTTNECTSLKEKNAELNRQIQELQHTLQSQQQFRAHSNHSPYSTTGGGGSSHHTDSTESKHITSGAADSNSAKSEKRRNTLHGKVVGQESRSPLFRTNEKQTSAKDTSTRPNSSKGPTGIAGPLPGFNATRPRRATMGDAAKDYPVSDDNVILASPAFTSQNKAQQNNYTSSSRATATYKTPPTRMMGISENPTQERPPHLKIGDKYSRVDGAAEERPQTVLQYLRQQRDGDDAYDNKAADGSFGNRLTSHQDTDSTSEASRNNKSIQSTDTNSSGKIEYTRRPSSNFKSRFDAAEQKVVEEQAAWTGSDSSDQEEPERWSVPTPETDNESVQSPTSLKRRRPHETSEDDDEGVEGVPLGQLSPLSRFRVLHELKAPDAQFDSERDKDK